MSATKTATFEELLSQREAILVEHRAQLAGLDATIQAAARTRGFVWSPLGSSGGRVSPGHSSAKQSFHDRNREECIKRGWLKDDGTPDLEKYRVEMKAKKLKKTPAEVVKEEAAARARRQAERFKR
jgi:hypothetical protein